MSKYNCPICHKEFDIKDSTIEDIITKSKHVSSTIRGRHAVHKYIDTHYYVRHCKKCVKKRDWTRRIINITILISFSLLDILKNITSSYHPIQELLILPFALFLIWVFICSPINFVIYKIFFEPDIDYAHDHNALVSPFEM